MLKTYEIYNADLLLSLLFYMTVESKTRRKKKKMLLIWYQGVKSNINADSMHIV